MNSERTLETNKSELVAPFRDETCEIVQAELTKENDRGFQPDLAIDLMVLFPRWDRQLCCEKKEVHVPYRVSLSDFPGFSTVVDSTKTNQKIKIFTWPLRQLITIIGENRGSILNQINDSR